MMLAHMTAVDVPLLTLAYAAGLMSGLALAWKLSARRRL